MTRARRFLDSMILVVLITGAMVTCASGLAPGYRCGKDKAYVTAMKSDLRNLSSSLEAGETFATFRNSTGVSLAIYDEGTPRWHARATHVAIEYECTVDARGEPRCSPPARRRFSRPPISPEKALLNISVDLWLFAFSFRRFRRRRLAAIGGAYGARNSRIQMLRNRTGSP